MAGSSRTAVFFENLQRFQTVVTIGAILVGGFWTWLLFVQQRQHFPHLKIEHHVTHQQLPDHRTLLILDAVPTNIGAVKVSLTHAKIKIFSLQPQEFPGDAVDRFNQGVQPGTDEPNALWTIAASREQDLKSDIEPGESDQLHYEFIVSDDDAPLMIYTYFSNPAIKDSKIGWITRTVYDPRSKAEH